MSKLNPNAAAFTPRSAQTTGQIKTAWGAPAVPTIAKENVQPSVNNITVVSLPLAEQKPVAMEPKKALAPAQVRNSSP
jgi:hypothetical protein